MGHAMRAVGSHAFCTLKQLVGLYVQRLVLQLPVAIRHQPVLPVLGFGSLSPGQASEAQQGSGAGSLTSLAQMLIVEELYFEMLDLQPT